MTEVSEDSFTHDGKIYDLPKVRKLVQHDKAFLLKIDQLTWILKYDKPKEDRIFSAKLRYPLLVTKYKGRWCVIDGIHRLERYRRKGIGVIPVKYVSQLVLNKCFLRNEK